MQAFFMFKLHNHVSAASIALSEAAFNFIDNRQIS